MLCASKHSLFFPSHPSYAHLWPLRMSGAHIFSNAHETAVSSGVFYTADTVSGRAIYPPSKLIVLSSGRCTYTTSTIAIGHVMGSFPSCRTPAIGSQGVQKSLPNSRGIFPMQMAQLRGEHSSFYMVWDVLERLRFAWSWLKKCLTGEFLQRGRSSPHF